MLELERKIRFRDTLLNINPLTADKFQYGYNIVYLQKLHFNTVINIVYLR